MNKLGIYVHIPFCVQKCRYCDFYSLQTGNDEIYAEYRSALSRHFAGMSQPCQNYVIDSIYFGGGTPSLLPHSVLCGILLDIKRYFTVMDDCEITLEMNPKTASQEALCAYYQAGFNRLSIGCQSANERELKMLGRLHNFADFQSTMEMARAAGFENISADLMMSLPDQTLDSLGHSIDSIVACRPTHISVYGLKIEGGTWFDRHKQELNLPNEEQESEQYLFTVEKLREHGYLQYEISNFALVGYPSRHNLKYWHGQPYLGFGPAAYSYFENRRYGYSRSLADYIEATKTMDFSSVLQDEETLGEDERLQEKLLLGLRLNEGVRLSQYPFSEKAISRIMEFVSQGLCQLQDGNLSLTPTGMLLDNYITSDLLLYL